MEIESVVFVISYILNESMNNDKTNSDLLSS